jgi:hypothetical protein
MLSARISETKDWGERPLLEEGGHVSWAQASSSSWRPRLTLSFSPFVE